MPYIRAHYRGEPELTRYAGPCHIRQGFKVQIEILIVTGGRWASGGGGAKSGKMLNV